MPRRKKPINNFDQLVIHYEQFGDLYYFVLIKANSHMRV